VSTTVQKVPVAFHSTTNKASLNYMQYLTPYAYDFVARQMTLKDKIKFTEDGPKLYHLSTAEGKIEVTTVSCQCMSWKSMWLPCRHILAARANAQLDMFSESLCDRRWSLSFYKAQQRVFSRWPSPYRSWHLCSNIFITKKQDIVSGKEGYIIALLSFLCI